MNATRQLQDLGQSLLPSVPLTECASWKALQSHHSVVGDVHLRQLFADDPQRGTRLALEASGLYLDYSKQRVTDETLRLLLRLAKDRGLADRIEAMLLAWITLARRRRDQS